MSLSDELQEGIVAERWKKDRVFVRALVGKYGEVYRQLLQAPRVYSSKKVPFSGGPVAYGKHVISPQKTNISQAFECHIEVITPGGWSQKHGHMNGAVMYVLAGKGHDVHDGERLDWEAGDAFIVKNACVHQHFNDDPEQPCYLLVMKGKPIYMFFHLLFQKTVTWPPEEPKPGWENWRPAD